MYIYIGTGSGIEVAWYLKTCDLEEMRGKNETEDTLDKLYCRYWK